MAFVRCRFGGRNQNSRALVPVRRGEVTVKEECHPQQMLRESGVATAISTSLPLSRGDGRGADLGGPERLPAALGDTAAAQNRRTLQTWSRKS